MAFCGTKRLVVHSMISEDGITGRSGGEDNSQALLLWKYMLALERVQRRCRECRGNQDASVLRGEWIT